MPGGTAPDERETETMTNWMMLPETVTRPTRVKGAGVVFAPYTGADGDVHAVVQPGNGVDPYTDPLTGAAGTVPTEHPSIYARRFGNTPGPEWEVNGRPSATTWTVTRSTGRDGSTRVKADPGIVHDLTPAAYRTVSDWLESDEVAAVLFDPAALAKSDADSAETKLHYAREEFEKARAALNDAEHLAADARQHLARLS